jgi:Mrp family chromosome partitioning ATPase
MRLPLLDEPESAAAAGFRVLRHRLAAHGRARTLLVTSPDGGDEKGWCAANLAFALAEAGRARVLLLEADFHQPSLSRLLGFDPPLCIGRQLKAHRSRPDHAWVVVETAVPSLHVAAIAPGSDARPDFDAALALVFAEFQHAGYDYVVVDGPPILGHADANLIEESVDGILLALSAGTSRARTVRAAVEQIGTGKLLGAALLHA